MSEIFSVQLTAVATAVLAFFAIVTAILAGLAFRKQSREVSDQAEMLDLQRRQLAAQQKATADQADVLKLQAEELQESLAERKREAEQQRRAQASRIFLAEERKSGKNQASDFKSSKIPSIQATIVNSSDQPVYGAELYWRRGSEGWGEPNPQPFGLIMPGIRVGGFRRLPEGTNIDACSVALRFTDAAGVRWVRRPDGYLEEAQP